MKNQGKRPEQIKFSEDVSYYATLGMIITFLLIFLIQ
jgi:hypothetical protein